MEPDETVDRYGRTQAQRLQAIALGRIDRLDVQAVLREAAGWSEEQIAQWEDGDLGQCAEYERRSLERGRAALRTTRTMWAIAAVAVLSFLWGLLT